MGAASVTPPAPQLLPPHDGWQLLTRLKPTKAQLGSPLPLTVGANTTVGREHCLSIPRPGRVLPASLSLGGFYQHPWTWGGFTSIPPKPRGLRAPPASKHPLQLRHPLLQCLLAPSPLVSLLHPFPFPPFVRSDAAAGRPGGHTQKTLKK